MSGIQSLLLVLCYIGALNAFMVPQPPPASRNGCHPWTTTAGPYSTRLQGMAQPETQIKTITKQKTQEKQKVVIQKKEKVHDPISRRDEEFEDAPMFKVMLLEDDSYDAEHVVTRLCAIMEDLDEDAAGTVFQQAMQEGKAMCGKYPFEVAELYKEQLLRSDPMIFCDLEEENA